MSFGAGGVGGIENSIARWRQVVGEALGLSKQWDIPTRCADPLSRAECMGLLSLQPAGSSLPASTEGLPWPELQESRLLLMDLGQAVFIILANIYWAYTVYNKHYVK